MQPPQITRQQAIEWFQTTRKDAIKKIASDGAGKIKYQCPLCPSMGDITIVPAPPGSQEKYIASYFCAECGFRIDDTGLKYFPPPPPPKHLRRIRRKQ